MTLCVCQTSNQIHDTFFSTEQFFNKKFRLQGILDIKAQGSETKKNIL